MRVSTKSGQESLKKREWERERERREREGLVSESMKKGTHTHTQRETGPHSSLCYATQDAVRILPILGLISASSGTDPLYWALVSRDTLFPEHIQQSQQAIPHAHAHTLNTEMPHSTHTQHL